MPSDSNHGVYETPTAKFSSESAYFEAFQCCDQTSVLVATPTSPMPPPRESGAIVKKGTAVVMVVCFKSCPVL